MSHIKNLITCHIKIHILVFPNIGITFTKKNYQNKNHKTRVNSKMKNYTKNISVLAVMKRSFYLKIK